MGAQYCIGARHVAAARTVSLRAREEQRRAALLAATPLLIKLPATSREYMVLGCVANWTARFRTSA
jgi:hypothetical protein